MQPATATVCPLAMEHISPDHCARQRRALAPSEEHECLPWMEFSPTEREQSARVEVLPTKSL